MDGKYRKRRPWVCGSGAYLLCDWLRQCQQMLNAAPVLQLLNLQLVIFRLQLEHLLAFVVQVDVGVAEGFLQLVNLGKEHSVKKTGTKPEQAHNGMGSYLLLSHFQFPLHAMHFLMGHLAA